MLDYYYLLLLYSLEARYREVKIRPFGLGILNKEGEEEEDREPAGCLVIGEEASQVVSPLLEVSILLYTYELE